MFSKRKDSSENNRNYDSSHKRVKSSSKNYSLLQLFVDEPLEKDQIENLGDWLSSQKISINAQNWYQLWKYGGCLGEKSIHSNNTINHYCFESQIASELRNILPFLLKCNDDINYTDGNGQTILHVYLSNSESSYDKFDHNKKRKVFKIVKSLLEKGACIHAADKRGKTPLHVAAENKKLELIEQLLSPFRYIDICDMDGNTVLHKVIYCFNSEDALLRIVRILLSKGADPNKKNNNGMTPLQYTVRYCNVALLQLFKKHNGDFSVLTAGGNNLLHLAYKDNFLDDRRMMDTINFLVKQGCDVNSKIKNELSTIHMAVERSSIKTVERLVELGADVNCQTGKDRRTPLHLAVITFPGSLLRPQSSRVKLKTCISVLSNAGADWDAIDCKGLKPFHYALIQPGNNKLLSYILNFDVDINDKITRNVVKGFNKYLVLNIYLRAIQLETIGFPIHNDYRYEMKKHEQIIKLQSHREKCLREVNAMKTHMISDEVSIYQFIHMNWKRQFALVNFVPQNLQQKFPIYNYFIQNICFKVKSRIDLLEPAKMAWYQVTKINLPDICVERILNFLNNWSLKVLNDMSDI